MANLKRYDLVTVGLGYEPRWDLVEDDDGEWVRFEDIKHLLPTGAQQPHGAAIAEQICPRCDDGFIEGVADMGRIRCPECKGSGKLPHAAPVVGNLTAHEQRAFRP